MGATHPKTERQIDSTSTLTLLGTNNSGKQTIFKQIRHIYGQQPMRKMDIERIKNNIQYSIIRAMSILCKESQYLHDRHGKQTLVDPFNDIIRQELITFSENPPYIITPDIVNKITRLWIDPGIQKTWTQRMYYQISESTSYFLNRCPEILSNNYVHPQQQMNFNIFFNDYLRINLPFPNSRNVNASIGQYTFNLCDVSQLDIRNVTHENCSNVILYVVSIADYDVNMMNGILQSINLFHHLLVSGAFHKKQLFLIFNNYDLFAEKIKSKPITVTFDDFPQNNSTMDPNDKDCAFTFIVEKFLHILADTNVKLNGTVNILRINALNSSEVDSMLNNIAINLLKKQRHKKKKRKRYKYNAIKLTELCVNGYVHRYMRRKRLFIPKAITKMFSNYVGVLIGHCVDFESTCKM